MSMIRSHGLAIIMVAATVAAASCGARSTAGAGLSAGTTSRNTTSVPATTGAGTPGASTTRASASGGPHASAGCAAPAPPATGGSVLVDGETRTYQLALPADLNTPAPVVLDLHGLGESAAEQVAYSGLSRQGPAAGMVVATPASDDAINSWTLPALGPKDVDFMAALLNQLEATRCIDTAREVAAGISNGAGLSDALVCGLDGRLAAIFPVSGLNLSQPCSTAKPTTIIAFHGTADPIVPYNGGGLFSGLPGGLSGSGAAAALSPATRDLFAKVQLQPVESTAAGWANHFACGPPTDSTVAADVRLRAFRGCRGGVTVELYTIAGGGHTWPGAILGAGRTRILGSTTHSISATSLIVTAVTSLSTHS